MNLKKRYVFIGFDNHKNAKTTIVFGGNGEIKKTEGVGVEEKG